MMMLAPRAAAPEGDAAPAGAPQGWARTKQTRLRRGRSRCLSSPPRPSIDHDVTQALAVFLAVKHR